MGMPHSNDLRLRVLVAVDDGVPVRQVVALLRVSVSYIYKALIRRRRTGETAARMPCGRPPRKLAGHEQALPTRLGAEHDATLAELHDWLAGERGVTVSLGCLWRTRDRLGLRLKKSRFMPPSRTGRTWRRPALRWAHCSLRHRWADQRRMVPHLCREGARTDAAARRHRDPGQSRSP